MTGAREKALKRIPYIYYPVQFKDMSEAQIQAMVDSESEINTIHPTFAKQLGLSIRTTGVGVQKIDGTTLDIHEMVVAAFSVVDKVNQVRFFEKTFLVANVSPEVVLGMLFFTLSSADVDFSGREFRWRIYTIDKDLPTTRRVKRVGKKEFAATALNPEHETYVVPVASLSSTPLASLRLTSLNVYPPRRPQISDLIAKEAPTKVSTEYSDFTNVFFPDLASKLPEYTGINDYAIELVKGQQPPYRPIYSLEPV